MWNKWNILEKIIIYTKWDSLLLTACLDRQQRLRRSGRSSLKNSSQPASILLYYYTTIYNYYYTKNNKDLMPFTR